MSNVITVPIAIKIYNLFPDNIGLKSDYDESSHKFSASICHMDGDNVVKGKIFSLDHYIFHTPYAAVTHMEIEMMKAITAVKVMSN